MQSNARGGSGLISRSDSTALRNLRTAKALCREALDLPESEGLGLARRALMLSDSCPEARRLLAVCADDLHESRRLLERALLDAEELVGAALELPAPRGERIEALERSGLDLLDVEDGPAYLDIRQTLGFCLARLGDQEGAFQHLKGVAFLDPTDGTGIGHTLIRGAMARGEEEDEDLAWELAEAQTCRCPCHLYSRALLHYRIFYRGDYPPGDGDTLLREALVANPCVPLFLLGERELPEEPPTAEAVMDDGWLSGQRAAAAYASVAADPWHETPGALEWLREGLASAMREARGEVEDKLRAEGLGECFENGFAKDAFAENPLASSFSSELNPADAGFTPFPRTVCL